MAAALCKGSACDFYAEYAIVESPVMLEIEQRVRGSTYGATSWTTRAQAEAAATHLGLTHGRTLLDLGGGSGWPALFIADVSGCDVVITDLPLPALRIARARAIGDRVADRCSILAADGASLPFAGGTFDRIHHADVLCCTDRKREILRECHRVACTGTLMEFSVITLTRSSLTDGERQLLEKSGPQYPDAGSDYGELLRATGWNVLEHIDVSAEFARCMDVMIEEFGIRRAALIDLLGEQDYADRLERRTSCRSAVSRGLLRREIFVVCRIE